MRKITSFFILISFLIGSKCFAETIYLSDGRVIQGTIIERGSYHVTIQVGKVPYKYYLDQIERIEENEEKEADELTLGIDLYQFDDIRPGKVQLIINFMEANGTRSNLEKNLQQIIASNPERKEELEQLFDINGLLNILIPIYDQFYSEAELREGIRFYESATGQKIIEVTPKIMKESLQASAQYFQDRLR